MTTVPSGKPWERNMARDQRPQPLAGENKAQADSSVAGSGPPSGPNPPQSDAEAGLGAEGGQSTPAQPNRPEQVKNAVQFLVHPKVQGTSPEERRKFLLKKGLTTSEIDEAFKIAQPDIDRLQAASSKPGSNQQPPPGTFDAPPAPGGMPPPAAAVQQVPVQPPAAVPASAQSGIGKFFMWAGVVSE